jgi:hypothetical protein
LDYTNRVIRQGGSIQRQTALTIIITEYKQLATDIVRLKETEE